MYDFRATAPDRGMLLRWINEAWEYLSHETIVSGFKKANMIEALPSADHVEQSVDIPNSVTESLIGALGMCTVVDVDEI
jgi:hypothetical protein